MLKLQMVVVVGISFNLIIIRVDKGIAVGGTYVPTTQATSIPLKIRTGRSTQGSNGVEVMISRDVDLEGPEQNIVRVGNSDGASIRSTEPAKNGWQDV